MTPSDFIATVFLIIGAVFFVAGAVGLVRFPDVYTRLHALTKSDNVGLGFIIMGLTVQSGSWFVAGKLLLIWVLVLAAGASVAHLIANGAVRRGIKMWTR